MSTLLRFIAASAALVCASACSPDRAREDTTASHLDTVPSSPDCGVPAGDVQVREGVGVLRPGATVSEIQARCAVVRDAAIRDVEGMPARLLVIALGGDTAVAEVAGDTVWRIRLSSPRFRTAQGFGVGTTVREIAAAGQASVAMGEGEVYMLVAGTCGVSYRLGGVSFGRVAEAPEGRRIGALPDSARVDRMLLWGCAPAPNI